MVAVVPVGVMWQAWCVFEIDNVGAQLRGGCIYFIGNVGRSGGSGECMSSCGYVVVEVMGE